MEYTVTQDFYVSEFDIQLFTGTVLLDGDLEPDLTAQLVSNGVLSYEHPVIEDIEDSDDVPLEHKRRSKG